MKHLGDITKINGAEIEPVWCIIGGSPCQDLSIAGKRAGLAGARSGLFMEQVRIVKEMREHERENGRTGDMVRPRYMVWENVPGAFSSNGGRDFAAVLEEIIRIVEPEAPGIEVPEKGWPTWGGYHDEVGGRWSVAWRVHDAQYWGVPQRRRRISIVADFGGDTAAEVQFERKGVSGDIAESGAPWEGLAEDVEAGASYAVRIRGGCDGGGKGALVQTEKSGTRGTGNDQTIFAPIPINDKATRWQGGGESRNHDGSGNGLGVGKEGDPSPTLTAGDRHGVMCMTPWDAQSQRLYDSNGVAPTLSARENSGLNREAVLCAGFKPGNSEQARMGTGGNQVPLTYGIGNGQANEASIMAEEVSKTLNTMHDAQAVMCGDVTRALERAKANCAYREDAETYPVQNMVVRRLTPMECERLQGYPDHWTDIGEWTDEKGKKHKAADRPRYKALGNSIALPFWARMLRRMAQYLPEGATLGSLFDGIGGFPLCWQRIHGGGTARWASEIEPFPIAVTKKWFGEEPHDKR